MTLNQKIIRVKRVFRQLAIHSSVFKKSSALSCVSGCSACCTKPDIEATILEFLPAAYDMYLNDTYEQVLESLDKKSDSTCIFYNPLGEGGACTNYQNRGLICRLFGFSSKIDKYGNREFVSCKYIKAMADETVMKDAIEKAPDMSAYYMRLFGIDQKLAIQYFPINEAIKKAIEIVLLYFQYRKKPA